jgi:NTF2-like N-terminal transpeptidase domain
MRTRLTVLTLAVSMWAGPAMAQERPPHPPPGGGQGPPPQAFEDCRDKTAGDVVQYTTRDGTMVATTCVDSPQGLVARPNQPPNSGAATAASLEAAAREAETAFRAFMEAWAYAQHWQMWEMGTEDSRSAIDQNAFAARLRASKIEPAAGKQVVSLEADPHSERYVELEVQFTLENTQNATSHSFSGTIAVRKEGTEWKFNLRDFLRLLTSW